MMIRVSSRSFANVGSVRLRGVGKEEKVKAIAALVKYAIEIEILQ